MIEEILTETLSLEKLIENGLPCVPQSPQRIRPQLEKYIKQEFDNSFNIILSSEIIEYEEGTEKTNILDLIMVCSNCHSMIHRRKSYLSKDELKMLIFATDHGTVLLS